jgi:hypothetical protein
MKTYIILLISILFISSDAIAQTPNPRADEAYKKYEEKLDSHENNMGETVQNTYQARDPRQEKLDERQERREDRREFRQQLKLERARRPVFAPRRRFMQDPWGYYSPYYY